MSKGRSLFKAKFGLIMFAGFWALLPAMSTAGKAQAPQKSVIDRPSKQAVASETRQILSDPRFAPRKTFWQWLVGKLGSWEGPRTTRGRAVVKFLVWVLLIWCVLTLLAILAHLVWTIYILAGPGRRRSGRIAGSSMKSPAMETMSIDELLSRAQELAVKGLFIEALGYLMVSILRRLGDGGLIGFHKSKTNGDYVREYPAENPTKAQFGEFVVAFEKAVYGGDICNQEFFHSMHTLSEEIVEGAYEGVQN